MDKPLKLKTEKRPALDRAETTWVFDMDNTLYPARCNLFAGIDEKMGQFISKLLKVDRAQARRVQKDYFLEFGTTLKGLIERHGVSPAEFLNFVHDIDLSPLQEDPELRESINALRGRKYVFTNGDTAYAERVLTRIGIVREFDGVFDIAHADYLPKPHAATYETFVDHFTVDPENAVMVEDMARNLKPAADLGMTTVWVNTDSHWGRIGHDRAHIHYETDELKGWLKARVLGEKP